MMTSMTTLMTALLFAVKNQMLIQEKMSSVDLSLSLVFCDQRTKTIMKSPKRLRINLAISLYQIQQNSERKQSRGGMQDGTIDHQVQPFRNEMSSVNNNMNILFLNMLLLSLLYLYL